MKIDGDILFFEFLATVAGGLCSLYLPKIQQFWKLKVAALIVLGTATYFAWKLWGQEPSVFDIPFSFFGGLFGVYYVRCAPSPPEPPPKPIPEVVPPPPVPSVEERIEALLHTKRK